MQRLQIAKLFFREAGLLEDLPKSSRRQSTRVHGHVGLAAIGVSEDFMAAALSHFCAVLYALCVSAHAQSAKVPRIGFLGATSAPIATLIDL